MGYELILHPQAKRELDRVPHEFFQRIDAAICALHGNSRPVGVKKLERNLYRIRVGDWRVIFAIFDQDRRIVVLRVVRRSEKTYRNLS